MMRLRLRGRSGERLRVRRTRNSSRLVGVDAAEAKHRGHDVSAFGEGGAGGGRHVEIAGGVDHHVAEDRLAPSLGLADDARDAAVVA